MTNLLSRLERLERELPASRQRYIWMEPGETQAQAMLRAGPLGADETAVFIRWLD